MTITFAPERHRTLRDMLRPAVHKFADALIWADSFFARQPVKITPADRAAKPVRADVPVFALAIMQGTHGGSTVEFSNENRLVSTQTHNAARRHAMPVQFRTTEEIIAEQDAAEAIRENGRMSGRAWRRMNGKVK